MKTIKTATKHVEHIIPGKDKRQNRRIETALKKAHSIEDWEDQDIPCKEQRYKSQRNID